MNTTHAAPRGTGAQDAPCSPASPPGVSPAACPVPERVLRVVRGALDDLRHTHDAMHRARTLLDARFGGCGRYEADVIENRAETVARATADLATFRAAAARNGVEADAVLRGLGGVPDLTPSPAAAAYIAGSNRPGAGRRGGPG